MREKEQILKQHESLHEGCLFENETAKVVRDAIHLEVQIDIRDALIMIKNKLHAVARNI